MSEPTAHQEAEMAEALFAADLEPYDGVGAGALYRGAARLALRLGLRPEDVRSK